MSPRPRKYPTRQQYREAAEETCGADDLKIEPCARIRATLSGAWVEAWLWVPRESALEGEARTP